MKWEVTILMAVAASVISCSNNHDEINVPVTDQAIAFTATVPKARSEVTTTATINNFKVWAFANGEHYMGENGVDVEKIGDKWSSDPVIYWPVDDSLNFFSISPTIKTATQNHPENPNIPDFINTGKTDLLYAVNMNESRTSTNVRNNQLVVNFRHALSQVNLKCARKRDDIKVVIHGLSLDGIKSIGSFNYPKETTEANISSDETRGTWSDLKYTESIPVYNDNAPVTLNSAQPEAVPNNTGYIFALPQPLEEAVKTADGYTGSCVKLLCEIYDESSSSKIWPAKSDTNYDESTGAGYIVFPLRTAVTSSWDTGRRYIYTLKIDVPEDGSGKIDFDITVDDYQNYDDAPDIL